MEWGSKVRWGERGEVQVEEIEIKNGATQREGGNWMWIRGGGRGDIGRIGDRGRGAEITGGKRERKLVVEWKKQQVFLRRFVPLANPVGQWASGLTIHPADADGLAEGEEQQRGAAANMMVEQLQQVHSSLPAKRHRKTQTSNSHNRSFSTGLGQQSYWPLWQGRSPVGSRSSKQPTVPAPVCSPGAGMWGRDPPARSSDIPGPQTAFALTSMESSVCERQDGNAF